MSSTSLIQRKLSQDDFQLNVSRGLIPGFENLARFGRNGVINTATTPEAVWETGGVYTGQPIHSAPAEVIQLVSDNINDASPAGTGARLVRVTGLNELWEYTTEIIAMNGTTPVTTVSLWRRVWLAEVLTAGSTGGNVGTITCNNTPTVANVFLSILPQHNASQAGVYTVPENKMLFAQTLHIQIARAGGTPGSADYSLRVRAEGSVFQAARYNSVTTSYVDFFESTSMPIPARTDIKAVCESVSDNSTIMSVRLSGVLVDV